MRQKYHEIMFRLQFGHIYCVRCDRKQKNTKAQQMSNMVKKTSRTSSYTLIKISTPSNTSEKAPTRYLPFKTKNLIK